MSLNKNDLKIIEQQLGRTPRGTLDVCVRDSLEHPAVLMINPIVQGKPFPSLYWLSHLALHKEIAKIEASAFIKDLENNIIPNDEEIRNKLVENTKQYIEKRMNVLKENNDLSKIDPKYIEALSKVGIGGLQDHTRVRCLHMHYAHFLVDGNIVGEMIEKEFNLKRVLDGRVS